MTYITPDCKLLIETKGEIQNVIGEYVNLTRKGASLVADCPFCNKQGKFSVSVSKNIWGCFSCDTKGVGYVGFVQKVKNISWLDTMKYLAEQMNINLEYEQSSIPLPAEKPKPQQEKKAQKQVSFRDQQLADSGLTEADQKYSKLGDHGLDAIIEMDRYQAGTKNEKWEIITGDDMVMHYMDLYGNPMMYHRKGTSKDYPLLRIRWANPQLHTDEHGKAMKYQSPFNSGSRLWINQTLRNKFSSRTKIKTLFIQEGEKKADKATKHNIISVGIMGIHNIAYGKQLPHEFELIIKTCDVENIVFIVDGDFLDIGNSIDAPVDRRPRSFLTAILNFKKYFYALNNSGINLNIYFSYIKNEHGEKGIDDLLVKVLKGEEAKLLADIESAMKNEKGEGKYINCHNITGMNEFKIKDEFFHMGSNEKFAAYHFEKLKERKVFAIGREKFKFSTIEEFPDKPVNTLVLAQPLSHEEEFWEEKVQKRGEAVNLLTTFRYVECVHFLNNRKFGRYATSEDGEFNFVKVDDNVVRVVKPGQIKDYMMDFVRNALQKKNVLEMLYKGSKMYLSENLNNLDYIKPQFHKGDKGLQYMYFDKTFWKITSEGIEEKPMLELDGSVWKDKIKDFSATLSKQFVKVVHVDGKYKLQFPEGIEEAKKCDFFNYFMNTSNFHWRDTHEGLYKVRKPASPKIPLDALKIEDITMHFISKCCGFGFMLHEFFDANRQKAVICMDGKLSEVGASNGRSGKSLFGAALGELVPMVVLQGKQKDLTEDKFMLDGVTERTRIVNVDDVRVNFDFEAFFSMIGGAWKINPKGAKAFELPKESSPKLLITTNHALNGEGGSFRARQFLLAFSDFYSEDYQPVDEHGVMFFSEWDSAQKNRFYNFAASCLQIYFEHGLVSAPMERLEKRRLRQQMGEAFVEWSESFYDKDTPSELDGKNNLNRDIDRETITNSFYEMFPEQRKYYDKRKVKTSIKRYCDYKGYIFNPGKNADGKNYGGDDKRNSIEYFTVSEPAHK